MGLPTIGAESLLDSDTLTVSPGEDATFPKERATDDRPFTIFKWTGSAPFDIKTDAGVGNTGDVEYFGLISHNLSTLSATLTFASSADDISYTTIFTVTPTDDFIIFRSFAKVTARFFRLRITGAASPPQIGQTAWGTRVEIPFGVPPDFDPQREEIDQNFNRSQTGNILGALHRFVSRRIPIAIDLIPTAFIIGTTLGQLKEWWDNHGGIGKPFFFGWNTPNDGTPGNFEKDSVFGVADPRAGIQRPLATQLDVGFRNLRFEVIALKE